MKVLLATEKPFAQPAVDDIRQVAADAGYELEIIEKYERAALLEAVATADALIVRSDKVDAECCRDEHTGSELKRRGRTCVRHAPLPCPPAL